MDVAVKYKNMHKFVQIIIKGSVGYFMFRYILSPNFYVLVHIFLKFVYFYLRFQIGTENRVVENIVFYQKKGFSVFRDNSYVFYVMTLIGRTICVQTEGCWITC